MNEKMALKMAVLKKELASSVGIHLFGLINYISIEEDRDCPDIRFNGETLFYNPEKVELLSDNKIIELMKFQIQMFTELLPFYQFFTINPSKGVIEKYEKNQYKWPSTNEILENPSLVEQWMKIEKIYEDEKTLALSLTWITTDDSSNYSKFNSSIGERSDTFYYKKEKNSIARTTAGSKVGKQLSEHVIKYRNDKKESIKQDILNHIKTNELLSKHVGEFKTLATLLGLSLKEDVISYNKYLYKLNCSVNSGEFHIAVHFYNNKSDEIQGVEFASYNGGKWYDSQNGEETIEEILEIAVDKFKEAQV